MEDFLEDMGRGGNKPRRSIQIFVRVYVIMRRFRSRDYHVTFPRVFPIGLWGVLSLSSLYTLAISNLGLHPDPNAESGESARAVVVAAAN